MSFKILKIPTEHQSFSRVIYFSMRQNILVPLSCVRYSALCNKRRFDAEREFLLQFESLKAKEPNNK
jgi:hypothetical protein